MNTETEIIVRDFQDSDYNQVIELWKDLGLGRPERGDNLQVIKRTLEHNGKLLVLVYKKENLIIGTSWITTDFRRTYIHHFGIAKSFQGRRLAHILMKETMNYVKKLGFQVKLEVRKNNYRAISLYKKWGFENLGDYNIMIIRVLS